MEDKSRTLSIRKALEQKDKFLGVQTDKPNYGYTDAAFFAKFSILNQTEQPADVWVEVEYPLLDSVAFYAVDTSGRVVKSFITGDLYPFSKRDVQVNNFVFKLHLKQSEQKIVVLRVASKGTVAFPIRIWQPEKYLESTNKNTFGFGIYYGMMLVMLFYNLFLYSVLREKTYLFYFLNIVAIILFQMSFNGFGFQYLWSSIPAFNNFSIPFFVALLIGTSINFTRNFLDTKSRMPVMDKAFVALMISCGVLMLLSLFVSYSFTIRIATFISIPCSIAVLYVGVISFRQGYRPARFFLLAWIIFIFGALLTALRGFGLLPPNFITTYAIQIGSALEVILLSLALADRISLLKGESSEQALQKERSESNREREQKLSVMEQNKHLETLITEKMQELAEQNKHIFFNSQYIQQVQKAILPSKHSLVRVFPEAFIYFKPKDSISGDFYWFAEKEQKVVIAAIDCTGHGVQGACMSMIGYALLNQIVIERGITRPAEILNQLHEEIKRTLRQDKIAPEAEKDSMDIALCVIHELHNIVEFAGANNSMLLVRNGTLEEIKGDNFSIGEDKKLANVKFSNHIVKLKNEDAIVYLASDGYANQLGGEKRGECMSEPFKELLLKLSQNYTFKAQHLQLNKIMEECKKDQEPSDDQLIIGFKISASVSRGRAEISLKEAMERKSEMPDSFLR